MDLEVYYDVVCPWAYLASTQVESMAARLGARVSWRPILLGGLLRAIGAPVDPHTAMSRPRRELSRLDLLRWADWLGVELQVPPLHPRRTVEAMRLCLLAPDGEARREVTRSLFRAYWVEGRDVSDPAVIEVIARAHGLDPAAARTEACKAQLRAATDAAAEAGAFGVPTVIAGTRLSWGLDRLAQLERDLGGDPPPPPPPPAPVVAAPIRVAFFHDFASPFSYLAATQIERVMAAHGLTVEMVPILLGGLFREVGTADVPLFAMPEPKQAWVARDLRAWASDWGVPFSFAEPFPIRSVLPLRVAIVEPRATGPLYRAAWVQQRRIDTPEAIAAVLAEAGFDADDLLAAAQTPEVKASLRDNTTRAVAAGACGVPTVHVVRDGRGLLLWGQDRLAMLDAILAGWWPPRG